MAPLWGTLSILSLIGVFMSVFNPAISFVPPLIGCVVFGALFNSSREKTGDRKRQVEINDRLTRIEELRDPKPVAISTIPEGHKRIHIAGHQVDVPLDPAPRPTRLSSPHQQGH